MSKSSAPRRCGHDRAGLRSVFHRERSHAHAEARSDTPGSGSFGFIDLFAGIGGIRLAVEDAVVELTGGLLAPTCVLSSEWDTHCQETYRYNFGEVPHGDINTIDLDSVPRASLLTAGFPCQPFSSIGRRQGFEHATQGNLFFRVVDILRHHRRKGYPIPALLLENVEGLTTLRHDGQLVIEAVCEELTRVGYTVEYRVLDAADFGVPQYRRRVFIVGIDSRSFGSGPVINWEFPVTPPKKVGRLLEQDVDGYSITKHLQRVYIRKVDDGRPQLIDRSTEEPVKTLVSTYHKIQRLTGTFVKDGPTGMRLLTRDECRAIMGFPASFEIPAWVSRTQAYRQFGNSVAPPVVREVAKRLIHRVLVEAALQGLCDLGGISSRPLSAKARSALSARLTSAA
jgi:DNA (cytosine-5)-methyltransferase 1